MKSTKLAARGNPCLGQSSAAHVLFQIAKLRVCTIVQSGHRNHQILILILSLLHLQNVDKLEGFKLKAIGCIYKKQDLKVHETREPKEFLN